MLAEVVERKERKEKASAVLAANLAVSTNQQDASDVPVTALSSTIQSDTRRAARHAAATAAAAAILQPLAKVSLRVLEAVRPHSFVAPSALAATTATGGGFVLYVVFEVEGPGENSRAQTRFNAPGSALVWLDQVRRGGVFRGPIETCSEMDESRDSAGLIGAQRLAAQYHRV